MRKFTIIYDTYCGWCYGASSVLEALAATGANVEIFHRYLFQGTNSHRMSDGFGAQAAIYDARIGQLSGQEFSKAYVSNVLQAPNEVLESGLTAQAAVLVRDRGAGAELALAARLQKARYVEGQSGQDRSHVVEALVAEGVDPQDADKLGSQDLQAKAQVHAKQAEAIMRSAQINGVPAVIMTDERGSRQVDVSSFYSNPAGIALLVT
jgi:putative protein-disulfide isomerase